MAAKGSNIASLPLGIQTRNCIVKEHGGLFHHNLEKVYCASKQPLEKRIKKAPVVV